MSSSLWGMRTYDPAMGTLKIPVTKTHKKNMFFSLFAEQLRLQTLPVRLFLVAQQQPCEEAPLTHFCEILHGRSEERWFHSHRGSQAGSELLRFLPPASTGGSLSSF